ncbi:MAG: hypothetical protein J0647_01545 [Campylobacteraceae bacterium]|nr:hypothetical protein [Campylobacteraceae bacterium]
MKKNNLLPKSESLSLEDIKKILGHDKLSTIKKYHESKTLFSAIVKLGEKS